MHSFVDIISTWELNWDGECHLILLSFWCQWDQLSMTGPNLILFHGCLYYKETYTKTVNLAVAYPLGTIDFSAKANPSSSSVLSKHIISLYVSWDFLSSCIYKFSSSISQSQLYDSVLCSSIKGSKRVHHGLIIDMRWDVYKKWTGIEDEAKV